MQLRRKLFSATNPRWRPPNRTYLSVGVIQRVAYTFWLEAAESTTPPLMLSAVCRFHSIVWLPQITRLYIFVYLYFYICISGLTAAILDFPMYSNTNNYKDISTSSRQSMWAERELKMERSGPERSRERERSDERSNERAKSAAHNPLKPNNWLIS